jgi:hypothetical protein
MTLMAFGMPVVAVALMGALAYGIARYNRKPTPPAEGGRYHLEASQVSWRFEDKAHR